MIQEPIDSHTSTDHSRDGTPPEIRRVNEQVLADLARKAGIQWDKGRPLPQPATPGRK